MNTQTLALGETDPQTIAALFSNAVARCGSREALVADGARLSFVELDLRTNQLAAELERRGAGKDTIVGALLQDGLAMVELTIACAKLGSTLLAMNWRLSAPELRYILDDAQPEWCLVSREFEALYGAAGGEHPLLVDTGNPGGALTALGVAPAAQKQYAPAQPVRRSDRWYMLYTSGTTGRPKGCQHHQGGYYINVLSWLSRLGLRESDCLLALNPLFHVHGFATLLCVLLRGGKTVIPPPGLEPEALLRLTAKEKVTFQPLWYSAPAYLEALQSFQEPLSLRLMITAGGAIPAEHVRYLADVLNIEMTFIYGQTEAGCWVTELGLEEQLERPSSCGKAMPHLQTKIVDDDGNSLATGEVGELLVKGETITLGYHQLPEATAETIVDGWLHTGDLFYQDEDGYLYLAGRKKELIKTGGENVYPIEVDAVLSAHPGIQDAAVVGVPDPTWGEAVKAFIVLTPGTELSRQEIVAWCREHIAGFKRPRYIEFANEIPRDFNMKIQRRRLAERETTAEQAVD